MGWRPTLLGRATEDPVIRHILDESISSEYFDSCAAAFFAKPPVEAGFDLTFAITDATPPFFVIQESTERVKIKFFAIYEGAYPRIKFLTHKYLLK